MIAESSKPQDDHRVGRPGEGAFSPEAAEEILSVHLLAGKKAAPKCLVLLTVESMMPCTGA